MARDIVFYWLVYSACTVVFAAVGTLLSNSGTSIEIALFIALATSTVLLISLYVTLGPRMLVKAYSRSKADGSLDFSFKFGADMSLALHPRRVDREKLSQYESNLGPYFSRIGDDPEFAALQMALANIRLRSEELKLLAELISLRRLEIASSFPAAGDDRIVQAQFAVQDLERRLAQAINNLDVELRLLEGPSATQGSLHSTASEMSVDRAESELRHKRIETLTPRERAIFDLLADRLSYGEIAERLGLSANVVRVHIARIMNKLRVAADHDLTAR